MAASMFMKTSKTTCCRMQDSRAGMAGAFGLSSVRSIIKRCC